MDVDTALGIRGGDIDDALAICLATAHAAEVSIEAISVVGGNVTLESGLRSTALVCDLLGLEVPISQGAPGPEDRPLATGHSMVLDEKVGAEQWIYERVPTPALHPSPAWELLARKLEEKPLVLVATGPLTNVARFLRSYPHLKPRIQQIVNMGGWFVGGGVYPEFNIRVDPPAAREVYGCGLPIDIVPFEMTSRTLLRRSDAEPWRMMGRAGEALYQGTSDWIHVMETRLNMHGCCLHDPLAVACLLRPDLFEMTPIVPFVDEQSGITTIASRDPGSPVRLATDFDLERFHRFFLESMAQLLSRAPQHM